MEDSPLFVLSDDVEFIPVSSIDHKTKSHFQYEEDDVIITHFNTRKSSKVIDSYSAELLKEFKSPKSWAEVIFQFAHAYAKDPQEVAEEAFQLLADMHRNGFLIPYKPLIKTGAASIFQINDQFKQYTIREKKRILDDTEVYFGQDNNGKNYVIKFIKKLDPDEIPNEVRILKILDGRINLPLIDEGRYLDSHYMITEWFESLLCKEEADRYRNYYSRDNVVKALDLCIDILLAYHHLHKQGILHGDVNDENILVSPSGMVKIIDYNMAVTGEQKMEVREGVCYYYEPELARTRLTKAEDHPCTAKGEQYAIATILYFILAGRHYINFSVEKEKLYQQILDEEPIPFLSCDLNLPRELDNVLATALEKDPLNRFASLDDFAAALIKIRNDIFSDDKYFVTGKSHSEDRFLQFITDTYGWQSALLKKGFFLPPTCSVNFGAAGIAYMFYRMACIREEAHLLDLADVWVNRAEIYKSDFARAFYADEIEINETTVGKNSLYHGPAGIHLVQCLVSSCRGDHASIYHSVNQYVSESKKKCGKLDVTLGQAGLLGGFAILYKDLKALKQFDLNPIILSANRIMNDLWSTLDQYPGLAKKNEVNYFGIAHGWAGILYATLYWCSVAGQDLPEQFMNRVEQIYNCRIENKSVIYWPVTTTEVRPWTGWCNGSAGHIFLWSLLYRHFKEEKYLNIAERTMQHVLQDARSKIYNLCCGTSGQAYSLLCLYNLTGEKKYLEHSMSLKQRILDNLSYPSERINSLYKSMPGAAVLFCELERPELARMPLFE